MQRSVHSYETYRSVRFLKTKDMTLLVLLSAMQV